ncbi:hypothetical protein ACVWZR_005115 [Bradyrhizobium sp. i1.3.1]
MLASPAPRPPSLPVPTRGLAVRGRLDFGARSSVPRWSLARRSDRCWPIRSGGVGFFGSTCRFAHSWLFWCCAELAMGSTSSVRAPRWIGSVPAFLRSRRRRSRLCCWKRPRSAASRRRRSWRASPLRGLRCFCSFGWNAGTPTRRSISSCSDPGNSSRCASSRSRDRPDSGRCSSTCRNWRADHWDSVRSGRAGSWSRSRCR